MKERKLNNKGFSLVELIIVIAIMVILVVVIAPQYTRFVNNSRVSADVQTAQTMATAIDAAVAEGLNPFTASPRFSNVQGFDATGNLPASKFNGGAFAVTGDDAAGVSSITLTLNGTTYECYPNPDSTGTPAGINRMTTDSPAGLRR